jgi:hypothetical protein
MYSVDVSSKADFIILHVAFIVHHVRISSVKSRNLHGNMFSFVWPKETRQIKRSPAAFCSFGLNERVLNLSPPGLVFKF